VFDNFCLTGEASAATRSHASGANAKWLRPWNLCSSGMWRLGGSKLWTQCASWPCCFTSRGSYLKRKMSFSGSAARDYCHSLLGNFVSSFSPCSFVNFSYLLGTVWCWSIASMCVHVDFHLLGVEVILTEYNHWRNRRGHFCYQPDGRQQHWPGTTTFRIRLPHARCATGLSSR
jgi:hypothetical protein